MSRPGGLLCLTYFEAFSSEFTMCKGPGEDVTTPPFSQA